MHEVPANGVQATVEGHRVVVGKRAYVSAATGRTVLAASLLAGETAVHVAIDGVPSGALILRDEVRARPLRRYATCAPWGSSTS